MSLSSHSETPLRCNESLEAIQKSLEVRRDGFEFHVLYANKFGDHKNDKLEAALEHFQELNVFKPHVSVLKAGIRLVVTEWDGENFIELPGIENIEHATPAELEALLRRNLAVCDSGETHVRPGSEGAGTNEVVRVEVRKRHSDKWFHLVYHRRNGQVQDEPLLIRANLPKFGFDKLLRPGTAVSMTALNDRCILERHEVRDGAPAKIVEAFPLAGDEDARRLEEALNRLLKPAGGNGAEVLPQSAGVPGSPAPAVPEEQVSNVPPAAPAQSPGPAAAPASKTPPAAGTQKPAPPVAPSQKPPPVQPKETAPPSAPRVPSGLEQLLKTAEALSPTEINRFCFDAARRHADQTPELDVHGFETLRVALVKEGQTARLVLAPHFLVCELDGGYVRFGRETRVFLDRLDDYVVFPQQGLRGVAEREGVLVMVASAEFAKFIETPAAREYRRIFEAAAIPVAAVSTMHQLLWPESVEEALFAALMAAARSYGLPVAGDSIVLAPGQPVFLGFRRTSDRALEFRNGEDYARFSADRFEMQSNAIRYTYEGAPGLKGWALDAEGRVCVICDAAPGFAPPKVSKLLRFLTEQEREANKQTLTMLASLR